MAKVSITFTVSALNRLVLLFFGGFFGGFLSCHPGKW